MAQLTFIAPVTPVRPPISVGSPLWLMLAGATTASATYWWMTRWMWPVNLEAALAAPLADDVITKAPEVAVEPEVPVEASMVPIETAAEVMLEADPGVVDPDPAPTPAPEPAPNPLDTPPPVQASAVPEVGNQGIATIGPVTQADRPRRKSKTEH